MSAPLLSRPRRRPEINLVPLIDVLVMLIFFAFVTMQFKSATMLNLTLPKIETAGKNEFKGTITISVEKDGAIYFNGHPVTPAQLQDLLIQAHNANAEQPLLKVDEGSEVKQLVLVEDACRKAGFNGASLQSRQ